MHCVIIVNRVEGFLDTNLLLRVALLTFSREIYSGIFGGTDLSELPISFPACRCPQTHPLLGWDTVDPSGVFCKDLTDRENITRLSDGMVDNLRDDNTTSVWTGSDSTPTVNFTFDQVFMVRILRLHDYVLYGKTRT